MNYGEIKNCDIANGPGVRVTLFVSGCTNHCPGCFQKQTWDFNFGHPFTEQTQQQVLEMLAPDYISGLTLLGGEPFEPQNQRALLPFVKRVRRNSPIKAYGPSAASPFEQLIDPEAHPHCEKTQELLSLIDVLVDGRFVEELKDITLRFRGSSNQRLLDMKKTLQAGKPVPWTDNPV